MRGKESEANGGKSKVTAGLLAIFLGSFGLHKFYLGYVWQGIFYLTVNTVGLVFTLMLYGLPNLVLALVAIIEGVIYLSKSDEEFERTYVRNRKAWF